MSIKKTSGIVEMNDGWLRLSVDSDFRKLFARLFEKNYGLPKKLQAPSNGAHITIADPWELKGQKHEKYLGAEVEFEVIMKPYTNGNAVWLDVVSERIIEIRNELLLSNSRFIPHLCLGYFKEGKLNGATSKI